MAILAWFLISDTIELQTVGAFYRNLGDPTLGFSMRIHTVVAICAWHFLFGVMIPHGFDRGYYTMKHRLIIVDRDPHDRIAMHTGATLTLDAAFILILPALVMSGLYSEVFMGVLTLNALFGLMTFAFSVHGEQARAFRLDTAIWYRFQSIYVSDRTRLVFPFNIAQVAPEVEPVRIALNAWTECEAALGRGSLASLELLRSGSVQRVSLCRNAPQIVNEMKKLTRYEGQAVLEGKLCALIGQSAHNFECAFTTSVTRAVDLVLHALRKAGFTKLIISAEEYGTVKSVARNHFGGNVQEEPFEKVQAGTLDTPEAGTTAILVSHISYKSGKRISGDTFQKLRKVGYVLIVDGAQALGCADINANDTNGVDCYLWSGSKWLLGPQNVAGILFKRESIFGLKEGQSFWGLVNDVCYEALASPRPGERIWEDGSRLVALDASVTTLLDLGLDNIETELKFLSEEAYRLLSGQPTVITKLRKADSPGMLFIEVTDAEKVQNLAEAKRVLVSAVTSTVIRISIPFFIGVGSLQEGLKKVLSIVDAHGIKHSNVVN